jgi:signal transduction histidine kinase
MGEPAAPRVCVQAERAGEWWRIGVLDNGRGVPPETRAQAFLPFRRLGRAEDGPPGMGIGLAIARRIAEAHGGAIWLDETPGGGCAVYFTLPAAEAPAAAPEQQRPIADAAVIPEAAAVKEPA